MRHKILVPLLLVVISFMLVTAGLWGLRQYVEHERVEAVATALRSLIDREANSLSESYFVWDAMYHAAEAGDLERANSYLRDLEKTNPLLISIGVTRGVPPSDNHSIAANGNQLSIVFPIHDDFEERTVPDAVGIAVLDLHRLLGLLATEPLGISGSRGIKVMEGLYLVHGWHHLSMLDILLIGITGTMLSLLLLQRYRKQALFFENTRGLESIIYLFEQTEKLSASHSRNTAILALFLGQKMGMRGRRLKNLYLAALLHDIGKIGIPTHIIQKTESLDAEEVEIMRTHPVISARILSSFREFEHLGDIVRYHHERMDGSGYPDGLRGESIPLESRIIAVVDVFEALIGERPYRLPVEAAEAFARMRTMPLDQQLVVLLERGYRELAEYRPPRWVLGYSPWILP